MINSDTQFTYWCFSRHAFPILRSLCAGCVINNLQIFIFFWNSFPLVAVLTPVVVFFHRGKVKMFTCTVRNVVFLWLKKCGTFGGLNRILRGTEAEFFKIHTTGTVSGKTGRMAFPLLYILIERWIAFLRKFVNLMCVIPVVFLIMVRSYV